MALTLLPRVTFNRITGKVVLQDLSNYTAAGYNFSGADTAYGYIRFEYNTGAGWIYAYNNYNGSTPDVNVGTSTTAIADIDIPLSDDGTPLNVEYRLSYRVQGTRTVSGSEVVENVATTATYTYIIVDPEVCIDVTHSCGGSTITSQDITTYSITGTTISSHVRQHTLYPPPTSGASSISGNLITLIYAPLYTLTWSAEVISTITWVQDDGLYVSATLEGVKEHLVVCDDSLSQLMCCLTDANTTYQNLLTSNTVKATDFNRNHYQPAWSALTLLLAAQQAGDTETAATQYAHIVSLLGCTNCACSSDASVVVQGNSTGNSAINVYNVDSPDQSITVTSEVSGGITTFHVQLSAALQQAIADAAGSITISTQTPTYIEVTPPTTTVPPDPWYINWVGAPVVQQYTITKQFDLYKNGGAGAYYLFETLTVAKESTIWAADGSQTQVLGATSPNSSADIAVIFFQTFLSGVTVAPQGYSIKANVMRTSNTVASPYNTVKGVECECYWFSTTSLTGDIRLRLYDPATGSPLTLLQLDSLITSGQKLYISLSVALLPNGVDPSTL